MKKLARTELLKLKAYPTNRLGGILLNANESPRDNASGLNRYPESQPKALLNLFSELYYMEKDSLLITRGSDEGIDLLVRGYCRAYQDSIVICPPTFGMYEVSARIQSANVIEVPLNAKDFSLDKQAVLNACDESVKLVFVCSPNNPTGNLMKSDDILELCEQLSEKALVIVDEAYIEFSQQESFCRKITSLPNLVVLRTLSKAYGLAGARCGALLANQEVINYLKKIIPPYSIPRPVEQAVLSEIKELCIEETIEQKNKLSCNLSSLNFVKKVWPSDANFILVQVEDSDKVMKACKQENIILRDRSKVRGLSNCVRISVGTVEQNNLLMEVLKNV